MTSWLFEQALFISALVLVLYVARTTLVKHTGAKAYYYLWSIIPIQLALSLLITSQQIPAQIKINSYVFTAQKVLEQSQKQLIPVSDLLFYVWLAGAAIVALTIWLIHKQFSDTLELEELPKDAINGISGVTVKQSQQLHSPLLQGFHKATLILPVNFFDIPQSARELMLKHELVHFRRGDLIWNFAAICTLCLFWFNPLTWWAYKQFRHAQEMACDAEVLANSNATTKLSYAKAFLEQSLLLNRYSLTSLHYGGKQNMKERLNNIKNGKNQVLRAVPIALALLTATAGFQAVSANNKDVKSIAGVHPIMRIEPKYPKYAVKNKLEGHVIMSFSIDTDGSVEDVEVLQSTQDGLFDSSATMALQQWTYSRPEKKLRNMMVRLDFQLGEKTEVGVTDDMERIKIKGE